MGEGNGVAPAWAAGGAWRGLSAAQLAGSGAFPARRTPFLFPPHLYVARAAAAPVLAGQP